MNAGQLLRTRWAARKSSIDKTDISRFLESSAKADELDVHGAPPTTACTSQEFGQNVSSLPEFIRRQP